MNNKYSVEIRCHGNENIGYGHIRRSHTLAEQLKHDGIDVRIVELSTEKKIKTKDHEYLPKMASVVIFDSPLNIDDQIYSAQKNGQISIALDWFGEILPDINISIYPHYKVRAMREVYVGFEYILIRKDVFLIRDTFFDTKEKDVLVVIGGSDLKDQGLPASRTLTNAGYTVTLIQGPLAKKIDAEKNINVLSNPSDLNLHMAKSGWMVTNGGGCLFEAMYLGKAAYVLPQTDKEKKIATYALQNNAILGIGLDKLYEVNTNIIENIASQGSKLVDGKGAERISKIVQDCL